jgi:hypothetical protein
MLKAAEEAVKTDDELEPEERQAAEDGLYSVRKGSLHGWAASLHCGLAAKLVLLRS